MDFVSSTALIAFALASEHAAGIGCFYGRFIVDIRLYGGFAESRHKSSGKAGCIAADLRLQFLNSVWV